MLHTLDWSFFYVVILFGPDGHFPPPDCRRTEIAAGEVCVRLWGKAGVALQSQYIPRHPIIRGTFRKENLLRKSFCFE